MNLVDTIPLLGFRLLTEAEAARIIAADKRTIRKLINTGRLKAVDIGSSRHHYRIDPADLKTIVSVQSPSTHFLPPAHIRRRHRRSVPASVSAYLPNV
jgi:excisionase family DNA binding protein